MSRSMAWRLAIAGHDRPGHLGVHRRVKVGRGVLRDQPVGDVEQRFARVLDEQAAGRQRRDPDVFASLLVNTPPGNLSSMPLLPDIRPRIESIDSSSPSDTNSGFLRLLISVRSRSRMDSRSSSDT